MATSGLYGSTYSYGGTYFEWFIFRESATVPATPTGGSWNFVTNVGTTPAGWTTIPPASPTFTVYASIAIVNSANATTPTWSTPAAWVNQGIAGAAATVTAGTTTTGAAGSSASVTNVGTTSAAIFNFTIPRGDTGATGATGSTGAAATITLGTVTTGAAGSSVIITNSGTSGAAIFNFTIPRGDTGATGATGAQGVPGINWLGTWSGATTYAIRDGVAYNGSSYYATAASTNQAPPNASYWDVLAQRGTDGSGSGTVTSVAATVPAFLSVAGSPITSSGTLAISLSGTALPVANGGTGATTLTGYVKGTGTSALTASSTIPNTDISGLGTMSTQNANAVAITGGTVNGTTIGATTATTGAFTTVTASTSLTTPIVQATNSAGLALRNSAGTTQISMGAGGGDNVAINVSTNINGTNAQVDISPTGTGHVHMKPTGANSIEIAPTFAGDIDNMIIGAVTPKNGSFVDLSVTGTTSFDGSQGTAGQVLTSAGTGNTPTWSTPSGISTGKSIAMAMIFGF
jgi:hypothetical protein